MTQKKSYFVVTKGRNPNDRLRQEEKGHRRWTYFKSELFNSYFITYYELAEVLPRIRDKMWKKHHFYLDEINLDCVMVLL